MEFSSSSRFVVNWLIRMPILPSSKSRNPQQKETLKRKPFFLQLFPLAKMRFVSVSFLPVLELSVLVFRISRRKNGMNDDPVNIEEAHRYQNTLRSPRSVCFGFGNIGNGIINWTNP